MGLFGCEAREPFLKRSFKIKEFDINSSNREFVIPTERSDEESQNIVRKEISHIR